MGIQPTLFDRPVHGPKAVRETSLEAYDRVTADAARLVSALRSLADYTKLRGECPTSAELMSFMGVIDPNVLRPRLTQAKGLRYAENGPKRKCSVNHTNAMTWRITQRGEMFLRGQG